MKKTLLLTSASIFLLSPAAHAADDMSMAEIQAQLKSLAAQVRHLSTVVEKQSKTIKAQEAALARQDEKTQQAISESIAAIEPAAGGVQGDIKVSMNPGLKVESSDGKYSFQPFGRVHLDTTQYDDDKFDHANNSNFRRARLGFKGSLGPDFAYKTEMDFAEENVNFKEVSLTYTGLDGANIKIGNVKPAFGMEQNTSSNYIMFMERTAATNAFTRGEEIGINIMSGGDSWSLAAGIFNEDAGNDDTGEDEDVAYDVRGSLNLAKLLDGEASSTLHLGAGYSHRSPTGNVRFSARPAGDGNRIIDTGNLSAVDDVRLYSAELAGVFGPFSFQSEYFDADVKRSGGNQDAGFDGYYAQAGWFLTGESRPYKGSSGNFGRVKPNSDFNIKTGDWGAWEVLARFEETDLNDGTITGGALENTSFGVNWFLSPNMRIMGNVINVDTDNNAVVADDDPTIYNMRAQWDF